MTPENLLQLLYQKGARLTVVDGRLDISAPEGAIDAAMVVRLRENKTALIALLHALEACQQAQVLRSVQRADSYELPPSLAQQRMLFLEELSEGASYYNMPFACRLEGPLDLEALHRALSWLLRTHAILRTVYPLRDDAHVQLVLAPAALKLHRHDLRHTPVPETALGAALAVEAAHCFDLCSEIPFRCALFALAASEHVLSINIHHIAADGHSVRRLLGDLGQAYKYYHTGADALPESGWQYADYAGWHTQWMRGPQYDADRSYWSDTLADAPRLHGIMTDYPRVGPSMLAGAHYRRILPPQLNRAVAAHAREQGTTPFTIYQAAFAAWLSRYSGESDIVFGTAAANRALAEFSDTVGLFVNTLVLRYCVDRHTTFASLVEQAKTVMAGAARHEGLPFDTLVDILQPQRDASYNPLVQIMLVMQDEDPRQLQLEGIQTTVLKLDQQVSKFDLALHLRRCGDQVELDWEYSTKLFKQDTLAQMSEHLVALLTCCLADSEQPVAAIALLPPPPALPAVNNAAAVSAHVQFEQHAASHPDHVALNDGARVLSYAELNAMAERVAGHLAHAGAMVGAPIGVCLPRSVELVATMLAIYKIGAIYVPLDPDYPAARLAFMVEDSGMRLLVANASNPAHCRLAPDVRLLDAITAIHGDAPGFTPHTSVDCGAYVIYTSGSTGRPKGVLVTHRNLFHSLHANRLAMQIDAADCLPTIGSQAFGVSLLEILLPLTSGGTVKIVTKAQVADIDELVRCTSDVTVLHAVPSVMRLWLDAVGTSRNAGSYKRLRLLLIGGEPVPDTLLRKIKHWRPQLRLLELYGMTEATIVCSRYEPSREAGAHYCIGMPYDHVAYYVLNDCGQQQPVGVPGELYIGGPAVARGYINQPGLTCERFTANPFVAQQRMYRTGDRVRLLADGNFEFLGRVDHQVSLRGARIELGEIETLANSVAGVTQAVAHVVEGRDGQDLLVLSYTSKTQSASLSAVTTAIRLQLEQGIPEYMRPSFVQCLDAFPLNPNGKVDRKKLPAPVMKSEIAAPGSEIERRVLALAQEVLQRDDFGVCASFFEIGGHSLSAAKLVTRIRAVFEVAFPLSALYSAPTVRACAALVEAGLLERYASSLALTDGASADSVDELIL